MAYLPAAHPPFYQEPQKLKVAPKVRASVLEPVRVRVRQVRQAYYFFSGCKLSKSLGVGITCFLESVNRIAKNLLAPSKRK